MFAGWQQHVIIGGGFKAVTAFGFSLKYHSARNTRYNNVSLEQRQITVVQPIRFIAIPVMHRQ